MAVYLNPTVFLGYFAEVIMQRSLIFVSVDQGGEDGVQGVGCILQHVNISLFKEKPGIQIDGRRKQGLRWE